MLFLLLPIVAQAADLTRMPEAQHVEAGFFYAGSTETGQLVEPNGDASLVVSDRKAQAHGMLLSAAFSPAKGVAFHIALDVNASWSYTYANPHIMLLEPVEGGGSYLNSPVSDTPVSVSGSGLNGLWLGASLAPFSESYQQHHRVTWKLDVALRTGSNTSNRWTLKNGSRGGGPGGFAFRAAGAFSRRTGVSEPYIGASFQSEGRVQVDVTDEQGFAGSLALKPASIGELRGGVELHASDTDAISIDLWTAVRYSSPENVPSGIYLPNVLNSARSIPITHSDTLSTRAGLNIHLAFTDWIRASVGGYGNYTIPHTQEHLFPVSTSLETFGVGWSAKLIGSFGRTPPS